MKGQTNNPNGRPKGVPNKVTTDLRQWITNFLEDNLEQVQKDWQVLGPKERIVLFEKLLKYSLPTFEVVPADTDGNPLRPFSESQVDKIIKAIRAGNTKALYP